MKCVYPMGGERTCPDDCPLVLLIEAFDGRATRLINRRLSDELNNEKDLELWARQQTWQHASIMVRELAEGRSIKEH
jgi:hypothetical protein